MNKNEIKQEQIDRFFANIEIIENGCWNWVGAPDSDGYGIMRCGGRRVIKAHRFSWLLHNQNFTEGLVICHHCDNPKCVNPKHLFEATSGQNNTDRHKKGRSNFAKGLQLPQTKLSEQSVINIINEYKSGTVTQHYLASKYNINQCHVSDIVNNKKWKYLY